MTPHDRVALTAVLASALAVRLALAFTIAPFQAPDEAAHLRYVEALARTGRLPVQPPTPTPQQWEQFYQPPLAYGVLAPIERAARAAGLSEPDRLRVLRVVNALLGSAIAPVAYLAVGRLVPPGDWRPLLAALVIALFPGFAANASVLNNDTLANLLAAAFWLSLFAPHGSTTRAAVTSGLLLGAACLSKLSVLALAPLLVAVPLCRDPRRLGDALRRGATAGSVAAAVMAPWMVRNHLVYGSPLAIGVGSIPFISLTGVLPEAMIAEAARPRPERAFLQFWGHFGIYNNLSWTMIPAVLVPLAGLGLAGWIRRTAPDGSFTRAAAAALCAVALAAAGLAAFSLRYHAAWQGRYLYTAAVPVATLLAGGWHRIVPARWRPACAVLLAAGLLALDTTLVLRLHAFFTAMAAGRWPFTAHL